MSQPYALVIPAENVPAFMSWIALHPSVFRPHEWADCLKVAVRDEDEADLGSRIFECRPTPAMLALLESPECLAMLTLAGAQTGEDGKAMRAKKVKEKKEKEKKEKEKNFKSLG